MKVKKRFQRKAKAAHDLCIEAIDAAGTTAVNAKWKKVFGKPVPVAETAKQAAIAYSFRNTEEFIEDRHAVDVRYGLAIDCTVTQDGFRTDTLRNMIAKRAWLRPQKTLDFAVKECDVPQPFKFKWKVLNRGDEAERRDEIRGQILNQDSPTH